MKKHRKNVNTWRHANYDDPAYQKSLKKYKKSMRDSHRKKLEELDKTPPLELINNRGKHE